VLINITGGDDLTLFEVNEASTLIQEAAHEDANIIFGAVIDDRIPEGEVRVTVIATGLDDGRSRRLHDERAGTTVDATIPALQREAPLAADRAPAASAPPEPFQAELPSRPQQGAAGSGEFVSPFEDELDVPTFIRRARDEDEEDRDLPAFLRRSAD